MDKSQLIPLFDNLQYFSHRSAQVANQFKEYSSEFQLATDFLYAYRGSQATFSAYRREIERLLQWSWLNCQQSILNLKRSDIEAFAEFCQHPPRHWIGTKQVPRFIKQGGERIPNSKWRPFVVKLSKIEVRQGLLPDTKNYQLSQKALQALFAILGSFYSFLMQEDAIAYNPVAQIRQKSKFIRKQQRQDPVRRLSELQWAYVIETAELLANADPQRHERTLFIMNTLYSMYLRISELVGRDDWSPTMGDFRQDSDGNWWFYTVGKGNKQRSIVVSQAMLAALKRYRLSLGLTPLPAAADNIPLIVKYHGRGPIKSTRQIRQIVQHCFDCSIERLHQDGFLEEANQLMAATVHWLRHTGISDDVKIRPREHVRDDAGHSSSAITDKYIDIERRERHRSGKHKPIKPDETVDKNDS